MQRLFLIIYLLATMAYGQAQSLGFTLADAQPDLTDVYGGSSSSGDVDGDGDVDLLLNGITPGRITQLYLNDGSGNFILREGTPFPHAANGFTRLLDLDGDEDLDVFLSGNAIGLGDFTHVYFNDGEGNFTLADNPELPPNSGTGFALGDVDGDGDDDLIMITEASVELPAVADVFLNNGNGRFSPSGSVAFTAAVLGVIELLDVEQDGDLDVIVCDRNRDVTQNIVLYLNDGVGAFTRDTNASFWQMRADAIDAADIDNDGDMDVLMSGTDSELETRTILYLNDGNGIFSELSTAGFQHTLAGSNAIRDLDNDGDPDVLITGSQAGGIPNIYNIVYENLGGNVFVPVDTLGGEYITDNTIDDFNGDGLPDIIIQGFVEKTNVYWNTPAPTSAPEVTPDHPSFSLFPNPSRGNVTIKLTEGFAGGLLQVFSVEGRLAHRQLVPRDGLQENLTLNLAPGNYVVSISHHGGRLSRSLVVIK